MRSAARRVDAAAGSKGPGSERGHFAQKIRDCWAWRWEWVVVGLWLTFPVLKLDEALKKIISDPENR